MDILRYTEQKFGENVRHRYQNLLQAALSSLIEDPEKPGSKARNELSAGLRSLHLAHCRQRVSSPRILKPRHIIFYRLGTKQTLEIVRILHDAMEVSWHLPSADLPE